MTALAGRLPRQTQIRPARPGFDDRALAAAQFHRFTGPQEAVLAVAVDRQPGGGPQHGEATVHVGHERAGGRHAGVGSTGRRQWKAGKAKGALQVHFDLRSVWCTG